MALCSFATWNDGFQKYPFFALNKWNQINVILDYDGRYLLPRMLFLVWMVVNLDFIPQLDIQDDLLEEYAALQYELFVLTCLRVPLSPLSSES